MLALVRSVILAILIIVGIAVVYPQLTFVAAQLYQKAMPCRMPITYTIGSIDPRFDISTSSVENVLAQAASTWHIADRKRLFVFSTSSALITVNFIYDERQKTTAELHTLGLTIDATAASYESMRVKYEALHTEYEHESTRFNADNTAYQQAIAAYEKDVEAVNARGGATREEYRALSIRHDALTETARNLQKREDALNAKADSVNALISAMNRVAHAINTNAKEYNERGAGEEFEEAVYTASPGKESIDVFEYDSTERLRRVLAHEFGHALGMEHVEDPDGIMYYLNTSSNEVPTTADSAELSRVCRVS